MQAQTLTPFQIFGNQVRYVVRLFQRPYVWTKVDQWDPLWNDVRTVTERLLDAVESTAPQQNAQSPPHFLGAIVLDQQLTPAAYIPVRYIIDGQQRLTTLQLLIDSAQIVMAEHGAPSDANDYSVHPRVIRRRVDVRVDLEWVIVTCGTDEVARHHRCWAAHQTLTTVEHHRARVALREAVKAGRPPEIEVEERDLADYDRALGVA
jgi:hypothetical protein